jgi:tRNA-2-methylthio-N6-dimethylallyladenosine synthase
MPGPTYYIETYGCQMNEHDSEKAAALLESLGYNPAEDAGDADVILLNTCAIREKAQHKVYSALGKLKPLKSNGRRPAILVAGCVAQQEGAKLLRRVPHLDAVIGTHALDRIPEALVNVREYGMRLNLTDFSSDIPSLHWPAPMKGPSPVCSYVTIMQGCSNFCAYCVVPHTRGPERSRALDEVVTEVRDLTARGVKEVTLLGQNVNAYGKDLPHGPSFPALLQALDAIPKLSRIRFTTSHPKDFGPELAQAMADLPSVCEHIHLALQSGSDRILRAMGRGYDRASYLNAVSELRRRIPEAAITTDIIVGFPGETDEDFADTLSILEQVRFDQIFSFKYSRRPNTRAARLPDQVPEEIKAWRLACVHELQERITVERHKAMEGRKVPVLIEGINGRSGQCHGRTRCNKIVNLRPEDQAPIGEVVNVRIVRGLRHSLQGELAR